MARTKQTARKSVERKGTHRKAVLPPARRGGEDDGPEPNWNPLEPGSAAVKKLRAVVQGVVSRAAEQFSFAVGGRCAGVPAIPGLAVKGQPFSVPLTLDSGASLAKLMSVRAKRR
jgi:hypothetical protein